ncbi:MAG: hypothetical protein HYV26_09460 [Candidatus Hydrogenedentes bacterium]|nr:hypothetical protein [Candidatus Hydrogenedentota bacterium]
MTPEQCWYEYVGNELPETFLRRIGGRDPGACVRLFMGRLPHVYGLSLRGTWRRTFAAGEQQPKTLVGNYLVAYLEETREQWEPVVQDLPELPPAPVSPVVSAAPVVPATPEGTDSEFVLYDPPPMEHGAGI